MQGSIFSLVLFLICTTLSKNYCAVPQQTTAEVSLADSYKNILIMRENLQKNQTALFQLQTAIATSAKAMSDIIAAKGVEGAQKDPEYSANYAAHASNNTKAEALSAELVKTSQELEQSESALFGGVITQITNMNTALSSLEKKLNNVIANLNTVVASLQQKPDALKSENKSVQTSVSKVVKTQNKKISPTAKKTSVASKLKK